MTIKYIFIFLHKSVLVQNENETGGRQIVIVLTVLDFPVKY